MERDLTVKRRKLIHIAKGMNLNTAIGKKPATGGHTVVCNPLPWNTSNGHIYRDTEVKTSISQRKGQKWGAAVHAMCFTFVVAKHSRNRSWI